MQFGLIFLMVLILSFFQAVVSDFNLLFVLVLISGFTLSIESAFILAFIAGLSLDLLVGGKLGMSSIGFLVPNFFLVLYRRRFSFHNPLAIFVMSLLSYLFFSWLTARTLNPFEIVVLPLLTVGFRLLMPHLFSGWGEKDLKIKV